MSARPSDRVIGFDIRKSWDELPRWLSEAMHQLGGSVPVSIDSMVLPIVDTSNPYALPDVYNGLELLFREPSVSEPIILSFTVSESLFFDWQAEYGELTKSDLVIAGDLLKQNWNFLGYDVADMPGMISGIANCGLKSADVTRLLREDLFRFNSNALIQSYEAASRFAEIRSAQIPSHAPFRVIGVWRKRAIGAR
jgi:hypothetical protein